MSSINTRTRDYAFKKSQAYLLAISFSSETIGISSMTIDESTVNSSVKVIFNSVR